MGMWFDLLWECSSTTRIAVWIAAAAAGLALFASQMLKMFRHAKAAALARRIDSAGAPAARFSPDWNSIAAARNGRR